MKTLEFIEKNQANLPPELAETLLQESSIWTESACCGYCVIAMQNAGYKRTEIYDVLRNLHSAFDEYTVEEAEQKWIAF